MRSNVLQVGHARYAQAVEIVDIDGTNAEATIVARDVRLLLDGLAARFGGNARAVIELAAALVRVPDVEDVGVVTGRDSLVGQELRASGIRLVVSPLPSPIAQLPFRLVWEALRLSAIAEELEADVLLSFSGIVLRHPRQPVMSLVSSSVPFEGRVPRRNLRRLAIARTVRRSFAVYVPTRHMHDLLTVPNAKVVPWGVNRSLFRPIDRVGTEVLAVGDFYPHKRHDLVLEAWLGLSEPRPVLRVIGNPAVNRRCFKSFAERARRHRGVVIEGPLPHADVAARYHSARTLVLASESESFCLPLAEAMACGLPAVARDHPALRETGGAAAIYVESPDPENWATAIASLYHDDARHSFFRSAALREAKRFSWDDVASRVVADCHSVLRLRPGDEDAG